MAKRPNIVLSMRVPQDKDGWIQTLGNFGIEPKPHWQRDDAIRALLKWAGASVLESEPDIRP